MSALVDITVKATALLLAARVVVRLMRGASAASRHLVWMGFFAGVAVLPLGSAAMPPLRLPLLAAAPPAASTTLAPTAPAALVPVSPGLSVQSVPAAAVPPPSRNTRWRGAAVLIAVWLAGLVLVLARMAAGAAGVRRLSRRSRPLTTAAVIDQLERARQALGVRRAIVLLTIDEDVMPMTWGLRHPAILLPSAFDRSSRDAGATNAVILHEVAHVARFDVVAQSVTQLVAAALWFHPGVWMAKRAARLDRERACDDAAIRHGARPADFAMELLMLVREFRPIRAAAPGALGAARRSQLDCRIRGILDRGANRRGASRASVACTALLAAAAMPVAAAHLAARQPIAIAAPAILAPAPVSASSTVTVSARPGLVLRVVPSVGEGTQTVFAQETTQAEIPWHAERAGMYQQVIAIARQLIDSCRAQIQIGTMTPIDVRDAEATLDTLVARARAAALSSAAPPTPAERAVIRSRFAGALQTLDADKTKFAVGLLRVGQFGTDLLSTASVLGPATATVGQPQAQLTQGDRVEHVVGEMVLIVGTPGAVKLPFDVKRVAIGRPDVIGATGVSPREVAIDPKAPGVSSLNVFGETSRWEFDVEVRAAPTTFPLALEAALAMPSDAARGDALVALARRTVFTPEMVSRFVEAVSRLDAADRDRVLSVPIHVRPGG